LPALKTVAHFAVVGGRAPSVFGVRGHVRALESGDMSPHSKV